MCIIIDINVLPKAFDEGKEDFSLIRKAISDGHAIIVCGGRLRREYIRMRRYSSLFTELERAGRYKSFSDEEVDREEQLIESQCRSDDAHIVALARIARARLLCSEDVLLHEDFTNPILLTKPRGKIYRNDSHHDLLRNACKLCR